MYRVGVSPLPFRPCWEQGLLLLLSCVCFLQSWAVIGAVPGDSHHLSLVPDSAVDDAWGDRRTTVRAGTGFPQKMLFPSSSLIPVTTSLFYALSFFFPMLEVL